MNTFINRNAELTFLDRALRFDRGMRGEMLLLYGRRRVGKTYLLKHWAARSGLSFTYWVAEREPSALQRRRLFARITGSDNPLTAPAFESWADVWRLSAQWFKNANPTQRRILVLDELPYAIESDSAMLTSLQHAWDQHFQNMPIAIALCGSHVKTMELLQTYSSPLFGRMTGQWQVQPLPFAALRHFFPNWSAEERVALYAIVGGVAAYIDWLRPQLGLLENLREIVFAPGSMFASEPMLLLYDEVREPASYLGIMKAIGSGQHTLDEISNTCLIGKSHLSAYLDRLQDMRLIERRVPATVKPNERSKSRRGRYHLRDPFMRFYFRFIAPYQDSLQFDPEPVLTYARDGLRAFVGATAFEELAREWVRQQGRSGQIRINNTVFSPETVGSHWARTAQTDVVAVNWTNKQVLIGECKWGLDGVDRQIARDLIEHKLPAVLADLPEGGAGWHIKPMLFTRGAATAAAVGEMRLHNGEVITLSQLDDDLQEA